MMPNIGMNLWVTADTSQGGRKYMEDVIDVKFDQKEEPRYAYFAVFDGHGGPEAATFAKKHLLKEITKHEGFWCEDDDDKVLNAISEGFKSTHKLMWNAVGTWPLTSSGYPSTSGCTASVVFIKHGKMYVGHVGDSAIVVGEDVDGVFNTHCLTEDHKPDKFEELQRIEQNGGRVLVKAGVHRVVWDRPRKSCKGPVRRSTPIDHIPFLAVSRALGDLWSYNADNDTFVVSPEPDVCCYKLDPTKHKCLVLASDGLWNMLKPNRVVQSVLSYRMQHDIEDGSTGTVARHLLEMALLAWQTRTWRADNISVIVVEIDPPGIEECSQDYVKTPSRASSISTVLLSEEGSEEEKESDSGDTPREWDHDDLPRSTSGTPVSGTLVPFTPLNQCLVKKQPLNLLRLATAPKVLPPKLKGKTFSKYPSFEGDDQDSRDTGTFNLPDRFLEVEKLTGDSKVPNLPKPNQIKKSKLIFTGVQKDEEGDTAQEPSCEEQLKESKEASCSDEATVEGSAKPLQVSSVKPPRVTSPHSKLASPRSPRQVGLNLTNSSESTSAIHRRSHETPVAGWSGTKPGDQEQQGAACSALATELGASIWPESPNLSGASLPAGPAPDVAPACEGACEYTPENQPCKKCQPSQCSIKKIQKRKAFSGLLPLSKRFRSSAMQHRTRTSIAHIRTLQARSTRKTSST